MNENINIQIPKEWYNDQDKTKLITNSGNF